MRPIGFSTGAIALGNWQEALRRLTDSQADAIELSALREQEFEPLLNALPGLDLSVKYKKVFIHAPGSIEKMSETKLIDLLCSIASRNWPIIIHPDIIHDYTAWNVLGGLICIENMDRRKRSGKTVSELMYIFDRLPSASFCFDIGHARHIDRSMSQAETMVSEFGARLRVIHLSEVDFYGHHTSLSLMGMLSFSKIVKVMPKDCPVILECRTLNSFNEDIAFVQKFLTLSNQLLAQVI